MLASHGSVAKNRGRRHKKRILYNLQTASICSRHGRNDEQKTESVDTIMFM